MKTLILVRHAKSSWKDSGLKDIERPLNSRGKRDAPFMANLLKKTEFKAELYISSTAVRAATTAKKFAEINDYPEEEIFFSEELYEAFPSEILNVIQSADDRYSSIILFAHNPGLTLLNNLLSDKHLDNLPTCGMIVLEFGGNSWKEINEKTCKQVLYEYPKKYL